MSLKVIRNIFIVLALMAVVSLVSYKLGNERALVGSGTNTSPLDLSLMWKVKGKLESSFLEKDKIVDKGMVYGAIQGLVASLGDPYTVFLPPKDNTSSKQDLAGEFGGVGISLGYKDKNLAVMTPLAKTPAEKAGIKAGDLILKITDKSKNIDRDTGGISLAEAVDLIRGKVGTEVTLKLFREGEKEAFSVALKRENIVVPSLELEMKDYKGKKVAWITLSKFSERIYKEWPEMVAKIKVDKDRSDFGGVVLDMRNNPGGFLDAAVLVASDFLNEGVVVSQESSDGQKIDYKVDKNLRSLTKVPLVVLVNGGSASAAEILAGALQEFKRAKLVGEKTFGKGTVQQPEDFSDGSGIHITVARWLLPNGKNIHGVGVNPDVEVKWDSDTKKAEQYLPVYETLLGGK